MIPTMLPPSVVHALCHPMPEARDFTPTRFTPAGTKAWFARHMLHFLASDCPRHQFTQRFHNQLVHCFGMVASYDRRGFWTEHFATTRGMAGFVEQVVRHPGHGMPNHAWHDVEREVSRRLRQSGLPDLYRRGAAGEQDAADRAELARLLAKYPSATADRHGAVVPPQALQPAPAIPGRVPPPTAAAQPTLGPAWERAHVRHA